VPPFFILEFMPDQEFLKQALLMAEYSPEKVGCGAVIVMDGEVVAKAFNSQNHDRQAVNHAEIKVLQLANKAQMSRKLTGATAYCSCEPCVMCLTALSYANVERIVYAFAMAELFPDDPIAKIDSAVFVSQLNFVPTLTHMPLAS
jgi:tRNA(adenine34) deaminase